MTPHALPLRMLRAGGIASLAAAGLIACAPVSQPPQQVEASTPSVTYNYGSDNDLVAANEKARVYCSRYQSVPSLDGSITENQDGTKTVTFKCIASPSASMPPAPMPMTYTYSSDMQLLQAMKSADGYCAASGKQATSNIVTNANGTKTITFQCVPR